MWANTPKTLSEIKNNNNILNLNKRNILELARIWTIKQLQLISESTEVNWINNKKGHNSKKGVAKIRSIWYNKAKYSFNFKYVK